MATNNLILSQQEVVDPDAPQRRFVLKPSATQRRLMVWCFLAPIIALALPDSVPALVKYPIVFGGIAGWIAFFWYRIRRRQQQLTLNAGAAELAKPGQFMLYLRPFITGGSLPVPCLLPSSVDRWLVGWKWDLELALSLAVQRSSNMVALGHNRGAIGAAKLVSAEENWQASARSLMEESRLIIAVPFDQRGTLWEMQEIYEHEDLLRKTVFVMPPMGWPIRPRYLLRPWRRTPAACWKGAQAALARQGHQLPSYSRKGALLLSDGGTLEALDTRNFNPSYLTEFFRTVSQSASDQQSFDLYSGNLRKASQTYPKRRPLYDYFIFRDVGTALKLFLFVLFLSAFRSFFFAPYNIPSGSMIPTLWIGDHLFVNKLSYGYGPYSLSNDSLDLSPIYIPLVITPGTVPIEGRILGDEPERGDVVVFKLPTDNNTDWIKRVIGLPGDTIQVREGVVYINDEPIERERLPDFAGLGEMGYGEEIRQYRETLPNGASYIVHDFFDNSAGDNTPVYNVPAGHYFMMGDNRDNSTDSRFLGQVGYVPYENLVGRATIIHFSYRPGYSVWEVWKWPAAIRWNRIFNSVE